MGKLIFNYSDGDYIYTHSDTMGMDSDGNMIVKISENMVMNIEYGDLHIVSDWNDEYNF